jgi:WD40 repeat protein
MTIFSNKIGISRPNTKTENLINDNFIDNFIYTLTDYFNSKDFNMKRTKNLYIEDLIKESELSRKQYKKIKHDERREYSISIKKMKLRHLQEKYLRMENLKTNNNNIQIYKLFNGCDNIPIFDCYNEYTKKELFECKKCLINNWKFPPFEYFNFSDDEKEKAEAKKEIKEEIEVIVKEKEEEKKIKLKNKIQLKEINLKQIKSFKIHNNWIRLISIFPSGNLISVSNDKSIKIFDIDFNFKQIINNSHRDYILYVDIKNENNFVTCSYDLNIKTWIKKNIENESKFFVNQTIYYADYYTINKLLYCQNGKIISC